MDSSDRVIARTLSAKTRDSVLTQNVKKGDFSNSSNGDTSETSSPGGVYIPTTPRTESENPTGRENGCEKGQNGKWGTQNTKTYQEGTLPENVDCSCSKS